MKDCWACPLFLKVSGPIPPTEPSLQSSHDTSTICSLSRPCSDSQASFSFVLKYVTEFTITAIVKHEVCVVKDTHIVMQPPASSSSGTFSSSLTTLCLLNVNSRVPKLYGLKMLYSVKGYWKPLKAFVYIGYIYQCLPCYK